MGNVTYFKNKIREYSKVYRLPELIMKNKGLMGVITALHPPYLYYNQAEIESMSKPSILLTVLHELAHVVLEHYEGNEDSINQYEREAEFWALEKIQKHEPEMFEKLKSEMGLDN